MLKLEINFTYLRDGMGSAIPLFLCISILLHRLLVFYYYFLFRIGMIILQPGFFHMKGHR